ncbi:MAG: tRNA (adenosine(37)-N6)-threonylcarbamoyltransferase complex dimerization subunit type 1 TsaB [bacterium]|nr:tRNA (adenosine(37)-N6)-threonylcarbamoyltransferase complex dimerization subunit type 1 TsaB [bacterium]MDT8395854.1 tRNA (adenosine(37)-N6)-threonylcarbamoyltransferase complex dimerization subunit type 1 TsaB [bacterium]
MIILAADTSTTSGSVAVSGSDGTVHAVELDPALPHSQTLLPGIQRALAAAGLSREDVQAVAVGIGPGAFTGLRVGLATLKGWSAAAGLPMVPVVSLDAAALPLLRMGVPAMVVSDARKGEVYAACYPRLDEHGLPVRKGEIDLVPIEEMERWIAEAGERGAHLAGTGVRYLLDKGIGSSLAADGETDRVPLAEDILAIAAVMVDLGMTVDAAAVVPSYVRLPDARPPSPGTVITGSGTRDNGP